MENGDGLREQLAALHSISVEIAGLHELSEIHDRALGYCLELTGSEFAFTGLLRDSNVDTVVGWRTETSEPVMDVAAIKGFEPSSPDFYELFHLMAVRSSAFGVVIREARANISNDVAGDPRSVGQPPGHPPVRKFLGVPLRVGGTVIGMIGVANKAAGYGPGDEALLSTFANEVAVAVDNARLYERQRETIAELRWLHERLSDVERAQLLARERDRIAGAFHDGIEQRIFTIGIRLNTLLEAGVAGRTSDEELVEIRQLAVKASDEVRKVIFALAVPGQANTDLTSDIRSMLRDLEGGGSGLHTHLAVSGDPTPAVEGVHDVVRSLVSEALTNIRKHANARMVLVSVRYEEDRLDVVIQDDGEGAPESVLGSFQDSYLHFGLRHMRQQTLERGGTFEVANGEETGLVLRISIPVPKGPK